MINNVTIADVYTAFENIKTKKEKLVLLEALKPEELKTFKDVMQVLRGKIVKEFTAQDLAPLYKRFTVAEAFKNDSSSPRIVDLFKRNLPKQLIKEFEQTQQKVEADHRLNLGQKVFHENPIEARKYFNEAAELENPQAHYYLAELDFKEGNLNDRIKHLKIGAKGGDAQCQLDLAKYLIKEDRLKEGEKWLLMLNDRPQDHTREFQKEVHDELHHLGRIYEKRSKPTSALKMYHAAESDEDFFRLKKLQKKPDSVVKQAEKVAETIIHLQKGPIDLDAIIEKSTKNPEAKFFLKFLYSDKPPAPLDASRKLILGLTIQKDMEVLAEARKALQNIFTDLSDQLQELTLNPEQEKLYEFIIGDLLTVYPFLEAHYEANPILTVPQKIDGKWEKVTYDVTSLRLGKDWMKPPIYAYGLTPKNKVQGAHPLLLFMGTPPFTTSGKATAEWVDYIPDHTVGDVLYKISQNLIQGWVKKAFFENGHLPVRTYGKSLGGAMCILTSVHCGDKVEANAYNPPGLARKMYNLYKRNLNKWNKIPLINVFSNKGDPVSGLLGKFPRTANFFQIRPFTSVLLPHVQSPLAKKVEVLRLNVKEVNKEKWRKVATIAYHVGSCVIIPFTSLYMFFKYAKNVNRG